MGIDFAHGFLDIPPVVEQYAATIGTDRAMYGVIVETCGGESVADVDEGTGRAERFRAGVNESQAAIQPNGCDEPGVLRRVGEACERPRVHHLFSQRL